jgi:archaellum biogenesis ATPase FlaH
VAYLSKGYSGLVISRTNPRMLRRSYNENEAELIWLTDHESEKEKTIPPSLEKIVVVLEEFMAHHEKCVILIDDLQYLISSNSFEGALRFIRSMVDRISEREALFLLSIDPASLSPQERSILEREMRLVRER